MRTLISLVAAIALAGIACDSASRPADPSPLAPAPQPAPALVRVDEPNLVCMVNDQFMGAPQIPVAVGGKIYFGCCEACRDRLTTDPAIRTAHDPLTRAPVDKASAVIARAPDGKVMYFASEENLRTYRP